MGHKKEYEEKQRHGTVELPLGLHKMEYPEGTDAIFIYIGIRSLSFCRDKGQCAVYGRRERIYAPQGRWYLYQFESAAFCQNNRWSCMCFFCGGFFLSDISRGYS